MADRAKCRGVDVGEAGQSQARSNQSEKLTAIATLAAGLLHEINNPLNYSLAAIQIIRSYAAVRDDELCQEILNDIDEGMQRIRNIVSDLQAFAYLSEADHHSSFDIEEALESAIGYASNALKEISVVSELPKGVIVMGSQNHITQVLANLLDNSAKSIKEVNGEHHGEIQVTGAVRDSRLTVMVIDNGVGMSKNTLERVFEPFFTTREVGRGIGLGLSVCHTIIASHGGQLVANGSLGRGAEFRFDLPLAERNQIYPFEPRGGRLGSALHS